MNSQLIRARLDRNTKPFVLKLNDGTCISVSHPDNAAASPGKILVINPRTESREEIDPLHVVAVEETSPRKARGNG